MMISILIPAYNSHDFIEECLDSVENQSYFKDNDNYEILLGVDGCEKTLEKVKSIKDKYRNLRVWWMPENRGCFITLNTLLKQVKFNKIIIFGSDDIMMPTMVSDILSVDGDYDIIRYKYISFIDDIKNTSSYISKNYYACGGIYIKSRVFELCGGFHENRFSSDAELLTRVANHTTTYFLNKELVYYRNHAKNLTHTVPLNLRAKFDVGYRTKKYNETNIKITPVLHSKYVEI